jgi:hypothetical protein
MFDTYFDDSMRFTNIMVSHPMVLATTVAINVLSLLLSITAILILDLSWVDVGYGVLATMGIGLVAAAIYAATAVTSQRFTAWTLDHMGLVTFISTVLVLVYATLGFSLFIGLPAALAVVIVPTIITSPMVYALRSWALRNYEPYTHDDAVNDAIMAQVRKQS